MTDQEKLFGLMSDFCKELDRLETELVRLKPTRHVSAARLHARQSSLWIKSALIGRVADDIAVDVGQPVVDGFRHAMREIKKRNLANAQGVAHTFGTIDHVLEQTYTWMKAKGVTQGAVTAPMTYDKTLSVLPGDPDFPTDPVPETGKQRGPKSFLNGDDAL